MQPGQKVGPFDIEKRIGHGAMGTVYLARYRKTNQRVAIKIISPGVLDNENALARFERESEVLKQLNHPNIVRFYIASHHQGVPYYAMEYIQGEPLDDVLQRRGRLTWEECVELGKQICAALQHAHDQGIVHRDLKPSNLMVTPDGTIKLTDFGIAKDLDVTQLTAANATVGTAAYMSPEQCKGERNLSHKSDLYSFGVMLYELLTGRKPFQAETTMDMFLAHVQGSFERPGRIILETPVWLDTLISQLLEKKPEHRPYDAAMVSRVLGQIAEKVAEQRSAGVDAAQARMVDRSARDAKPSAEDKKDARKVLASLRRGRQRKPRKPFYEKVWFQAVGILAVLAGLGAILYEAFKPPTAERLYKLAKVGMYSSNFDDKLEARDGPVAQYLRYYGNRYDSQASEIREWAVKIDVTRKWNGMLNRRKLAAQDDREEKARTALEREEEGDLVPARDLWQQVASDKTGEDEFGWGILAQHCVKDLQSAIDKKEEVGLREQINTARNLDREFKPENEVQRLASEALIYEEFSDFVAARSRWKELRIRHAKDLDQHRWTLLAARKVRELLPKIKEGEESSSRVKAIEDVLSDAGKKAQENPGKARARYLYQQIITLYGKDQEDSVRKLVAQARKSLAQLPHDSTAKEESTSSPSPAKPETESK